MTSDAAARSPTPFVGSGVKGQMTERDARALLEEFARSGMSLRAFSSARGFNGARLGWWKAKLAGKHGPRRPKPAGARAKHRETTPRFVPVVVAETSSADRAAPRATVAPSMGTTYELAVGDALTLRIPHDFHDDALARIVRVLRGTR